jgi:hypothetical protein
MAHFDVSYQAHEVCDATETYPMHEHDKVIGFYLSARVFFCHC